MSTEHNDLLKFLDAEQNDQVNFPVILKRSTSASRNDFLRRNTPLNRSQYKRDARVVCKSGRLLVYFKKIPQKSAQYAKDLWNTLINMQWRWLLLTVAAVNVVAYISCALLFYFDSWFSGDFDNEEGKLSCMVGISNMRHFFMLGIETITTIGYGYVRPSENCELYFVVLAFSTITTIFIDGAFISVVYAKLNKPKERNVHGHMFTKKAIVSLRDGHLCLIVRVNDKEGRHGINTNVCMYLIKDRMMLEGELIPNYMVELAIKPFGMLFWPVDVIHEIGPESPLWDISAKELMTTRRK
ncbi:inward rectifier potassium channel 2 isoform X2 [Dendroctonus ponderosae]